MPIFHKTCPYCGEEFVTDNNGRKYCTKRCANKASADRIAVDKVIANKDHDNSENYDRSITWEKTECGRWLCPYNMGVSCATRRCSTCGFNPKVEEARNRKIREAYGRI